MKNYTLLVNQKTNSKIDDIDFYKNKFKNVKNMKAEILMFHIFLTKTNIKKSINSSFQDINLENNKHGFKSHDFNSRFFSVKNLMLLLSTFSSNKILSNYEYDEQLRIIGLSNVKDIFKESNITYSRNIKRVNNIKEDFFNYIKSLHLSKDEFFNIFSKIASYYLLLLEEFKYIDSLKISKIDNIFKSYKRMKAEKEMLNIIINYKGKSLEKVLVKSYRINTLNKIIKNKNRSLIFNYISDKRVYKKIIWRENKKPKYYAYMPGFFDSFYGLAQLINKNKILSSDNNSDLDFLIKLISAELIINKKIENNIIGG